MTTKEIFRNVDADTPLRLAEVVQLLSAEGSLLRLLYEKADIVRRECMGNDVFLRGIIEISNHCRNDCVYCGIRRSRAQERYRIPDEEIISVCRKLPASGVTTVVLQGGEDEYFSRERIGQLLERIHRETTLAVTLSLGERDAETYRFWLTQGMDRYFMRFETSQGNLFKTAHPDSTLAQRLQCLTVLHDMGVQTGSGFLIGLPGETIEDLAADILFCSRLELDMIGVGPFIPHPGTPYSCARNPFDLETVFKVVAVLRLLNKRCHIPATTAFDAVAPGSRLRLLQQGANVFMPNATPQAYRGHYELYPGKPGVDLSLEESVNGLQQQLTAIGRHFGIGTGEATRLRDKGK